MSNTSFRNYRASVWLAAALGMGAASDVYGSVTYQLRIVGGGAEAIVSQVGQIVSLELFARVTGAAGNNGLEGFQDGYLSLLSSLDGNIKGNLSATLVSPFTAGSASNGVVQDLDGDGDSDVGSNLTSSLPTNEFIFARSAALATMGTAIADGQEFKLANVTFTVTSILDEDNFTPIFLFPRVTAFASGVESEAVWQEDGSVMSSNNLGGAPLPTAAAGVQIHAVPEPASALLLSLSGLLLAAQRRRAISLLPG